MSALEEFATWRSQNQDFARRLREERRALVSKLGEIDGALAMLGDRPAPAPHAVRRGRPPGRAAARVGPMTGKQAEVLRAIRDTLAERGFPPTLRDLMARFGVRSTNAISSHLQALQRKGMLTIADGASRGLAITEAGLAYLVADRASPSERAAPEKP